MTEKPLPSTVVGEASSSPAIRFEFARPNATATLQQGHSMDGDVGTFLSAPEIE